MDRRPTSALSVRRWVFLSLIGIATAGCVGRITSTDVLGRWELRSNTDAQIIELNRDATFTHAWISEGSRKIATGTWELTDVGRAPAILLRYKYDFDGHSSGASLNVVRRWSGGLGLSVDADRQSVFERREPETK